MKTIKQIADEIGISKTAVRKRITPEVKTKFAETVSGVVFISPEGESLIKQAFQRSEPQTKFAQVSGNQFAVVSGEVSSAFAALKEQLRVKDEQLAEKDRQIEQLTNTVLAQAQSINADRHNELAGTIHKQLTDDSERTEPAQKPKRLFARIFGSRG